MKAGVLDRAEAAGAITSVSVNAIEDSMKVIVRVEPGASSDALVAELPDDSYVVKEEAGLAAVETGSPQSNHGNLQQPSWRCGRSSRVSRCFVLLVCAVRCQLVHVGRAVRADGRRVLFSEREVVVVGVLGDEAADADLAEVVDDASQPFDVLVEIVGVLVEDREQQLLYVVPGNSTPSPDL